MGFSSESGKTLRYGDFSNLKLNTRLPTKKMQKLDVDASSSEEGKRFNSQIHLILIIAEIVEEQDDMCVPIPTSKI